VDDHMIHAGSRLMSGWTTGTAGHELIRLVKI
jgi:hypothetical protein